MCFQVLKLWPYLALWTANVRSSAAVVITHWAQSHHLTQPHQPAIPLKINHSKVRISPQKARFPNFQMQCSQFCLSSCSVSDDRPPLTFDQQLLFSPTLVVSNNWHKLTAQNCEKYSSTLQIFFVFWGHSCFVCSFIFLQQQTRRSFHSSTFQLLLKYRRHGNNLFTKGPIIWRLLVWSEWRGLHSRNIPINALMSQYPKYVESVQEKSNFYFPQILP